MSIEAIIKPTEKFSLDLSYARSRLWSVNTGALFYDGYITRGDVVYQFSSEALSQIDKSVRSICKADSG